MSYSWNMDYPMEYVFYGIAFVAIWTIINVFIEMTSEEKARPSKKFVHSKTYSDFRGSKWKDHDRKTESNNVGRTTRAHEGPITIGNFDWEAAMRGSNAGEKQEDAGITTKKIDLTIGGSDLDSKEEEGEVTDISHGKGVEVNAKNIGGPNDASVSNTSHLEATEKSADALRKEERITANGVDSPSKAVKIAEAKETVDCHKDVCVTKEIRQSPAVLETVELKVTATHSLQNDVGVYEDISASSTLQEPIEMKITAADAPQEEVIVTKDINESSSELLETKASPVGSFDEDDEEIEDLPPPPPLPPPLEEVPELVEPALLRFEKFAIPFFLSEPPLASESEPSGDKHNKVSSNDIDVLCFDADAPPSGRPGGRVSVGAELVDVTGTEGEVKLNGIEDGEGLSEDESVDVEKVEEGWRPRLTTCVPFGPPTGPDVREGDPSGNKPRWIACAPFGPPIVPTSGEETLGVDVTGIRNEEPVVRRSTYRCDEEVGAFFKTHQSDLGREDKEPSSYRRSYCAEDFPKGTSIGKYFGSLQNLAPKESRRASIYSTEERNLLKNNCGQDNFEFWDIKSDPYGWIVDKNPAGKDAPPTVNHFGLPLPEFEGHRSAFETVHMRCWKEQTVDLIEEGFNVNFLDEIQPPIEISEWITTVPECRSTYELRVKLLDREKKTIAEYPLDHSFSSIKETEWIKVSYTFRDYGPGLRYVLFNHGAVKWHGNRGCKMTGSTVRVLTP